jgi:hypothetical protein
MSTLARALIQSGLIPEEAVARCQLRALQRQTSLPAELVTATLIEAPAIARFIETTFGFAYVDLDPTHPMPGCPGIGLAPTHAFPSACPATGCALAS